MQNSKLIRYTDPFSLLGIDTANLDALSFTYKNANSIDSSAMDKEVLLQEQISKLNIVCVHNFNTGYLGGTYYENKFEYTATLQDLKNTIKNKLKDQHAQYTDDKKDLLLINVVDNELKSFSLKLERLYKILNIKELNKASKIAKSLIKHEETRLFKRQDQLLPVFQTRKSSSILDLKHISNINYNASSTQKDVDPRIILKEMLSNREKLQLKARDKLDDFISKENFDYQTVVIKNQDKQNMAQYIDNISFSRYTLCVLILAKNNELGLLEEIL